MEPKRLYRSRTDRVIAGVAGGLGEYFNIDPIVIRVIFVLMSIGHGIGVILYLIAWFVIPEQPVNNHKHTAQEKGESMEEKTTKTTEASEEVHDTVRPIRRHGGRTTGGLILIVIGALFLLQNLVSIDIWGNFWPIILIVIGISIMMRSDR